MFANSVLPVKIIMLGLFLATIAVVIICIPKLLQSQPTGGSAFISGLRIGGPVMGLVGAVYAIMNSLIGMSESGYTSFMFASPGIIQGLFCLLLGLFAGGMAIMGHTLLNARIDRALLKT